MIADAIAAVSAFQLHEPTLRMGILSEHGPDRSRTYCTACNRHRWWCQYWRVSKASCQAVNSCRKLPPSTRLPKSACQCPGRISFLRRLEDPNVVVEKVFQFLHLGLFEHGSLLWAQQALVDTILVRLEFFLTGKLLFLALLLSTGVVMPAWISLRVMPLILSKCGSAHPFLQMSLGR